MVHDITSIAKKQHSLVLVVRPAFAARCFARLWADSSSGGRSMPPGAVIDGGAAAAVTRPTTCVAGTFLSTARTGGWGCDVAISSSMSRFPLLRAASSTTS